MILSAYVELQQSKSEVFHLLSEQAVTLSETIVSSSLNALNSSEEIEHLVAHRLLNNARLVRMLDSLNVLTHEKLITIGKENDIYRINIFDKKGDRILTNRVIEKDDHIHGEENVNRYQEVKPILTGRVTEMVIGLKKAMHVDEQRFAVAVARSENRGAIVVNMNAEDFLQFRKRIGLGKILHDIGDNMGIEYVALQDSQGIIAASSTVKELSSFAKEPFLLNAANNDSVFTRLTTFENREVFEAIRRLFYQNKFVGVVRIGMTLDELRSLEARTVRRLIVISIILATIGIILLGILLTNQNLKILSEEFGNYKSFTNSFLRNIKESGITVSSDMEITLFNTSAEKLFGVSGKEVVGKKLDELNIKGLNKIYELLISSTEFYKNFELHTTTNSGEKYLSVSVTPNYNLAKGLESHTIIINDITESKMLQEQAKRNEKLIAMGELASGVAHEVRNPVNSIGMIAQRLSSEFEPKNAADEYDSITNLLKDEVNRINKIITQFLKYAKPLDIRLIDVDINRFMKDIYQLFSDQAEKRGIVYTVSGENNLFVKIDPELFKQTLINIIQNAFEAVEENGKISVKYYKKDNNFEIDVTDDGKGISESDRSRIFDLYYTTKDEGTGLGLSISQKIISQHNGLIDFTTELSGTTFRIIVPIS
jgi:PAS domain S-box-containing protein